MRSRNPTTLSLRHKQLLHASVGLLWLSGALWLYHQYFGQPPTRLQSFCLKIHGAAAMVFLMGFGLLLAEHVPVGWNQTERRLSGITLLGVCGLLVLTG